MEYITFIYALVLSVAQTFLGFSVAKFIAEKLDSPVLLPISDEVRLLPVYWIFGLLLHLAFILILKILGLPWPLAVILPLVLIALAHKRLTFLLHVINAVLPRAINASFLMWFALQVFIGASLFTMRDGISTPWMNNYGDLTFHLGMITNFVARGDFPADYHLYAGEQLSYPFFVNLWAAALWFPFDGFAALKVVFLFQWVALWTATYTLLVKRGAVYLPWILLLGGGSYFALMQRPEPFSWQLIAEGYPWTTWLSTIWVTQRSAVLGLTAAIAAACLALNTFSLTRSQAWSGAIAGLLLALMPLAHTHYFLFTALFLGLYLLAKTFSLPDVRPTNINSCLSGLKVTGLIYLLVFSLPALFFFPLLLSKSGMTSVMLGWTVPVKPPGVESLMASISMWLTNASQWFLVAIVLCIVSRKFLAFGALLLLFLVANVVKLASWEWDQLKVFLVIFTMMVVVWRSYLENAEQGGWLKVGSYGLAFLLCFPGLYEAYRVAKAKPSYQVYNPAKLALAELISEQLPTDAVIASPSDHNSAATLSGRNLFFGYPGTLASHNIAYQAREPVQKNLNNMLRCEVLLSSDADHCPGFVIWDAAAANYWSTQNPGPGFTKIASTRDQQQSIYKRIPTK